jgi:hypothetical protein
LQVRFGHLQDVSFRFVQIRFREPEDIGQSGLQICFCHQIDEILLGRDLGPRHGVSQRSGEGTGLLGRKAAGLKPIGRLQRVERDDGHRVASNVMILPDGATCPQPTRAPPRPSADPEQLRDMHTIAVVFV